MHIEQQSYHLFWGKSDREKSSDVSEEQSGISYHRLVYHLLDVAAVADQLLCQDMQLRKRLSNLCKMEENVLHWWLVFLMGVHDIGKFSGRFQYLIPTLAEHIGAPTCKKPYVKHDTLGYHVLKNTVATHEDVHQQFGEINVISWAQAIAGHHGSPPNTERIIFNDHFCEKARHAIDEFIKDWFDLIKKLSGETFHQTSSMSLPKPASWVIAGFAVLADWIGSNTNYFPYRHDILSPEEYWQTASASAKKAVQESGVIAKPVNSLQSFHDLFPHISSPTALQNWAEKVEVSNTPSLYIIEDIPGAGKTEAAIMLAHRIMAQGHADGLFFALPTMATTNQMYERVANVPLSKLDDTSDQALYKRLFQRESHPSLVLAHGHARMHDGFLERLFTINEHGERISLKRYEHQYGADEESITAQCNAWFADTRKKALLADVGIGTIDQLLMSILPMKHQSLRMLGMFRKVLIIDEVHCYDSYTSKLLEDILFFQALSGASVILLSATLSHKMRSSFLKIYHQGVSGYNGERNIRRKKLDVPFMQEYPGTTVYAENKNLESTALKAREDLSRTLQIQPFNTDDDVIAYLVQEAQSGKCVCWIRNTVHDAMDAYNKIQSRVQSVQSTNDLNVHLFHARFVLGDRLDIEKKVLGIVGKTSTADMRKGNIIIATQVIEQSLDVDFDCLVSDLAPMDALIQRMGRLHRHRRDVFGNIQPDGMPDARQTKVFSLLTPAQGIPIQANWYSALFPKGRFVYEDFTLLWRTAILLTSEEKRSIALPGDVRSYIEQAYNGELEGASPIDVPELLEASALKVEGKDNSKKTTANFNALNVEEGYEKESSLWADDISTPTRLGQANGIVRLGKMENGSIVPFYSAKEVSNISIAKRWMLSDVSVSYSKVSEENNTDYIEHLISQAKESMADKGKYSLLCIVTKDDGQDMWQGSGKKKDGTIVSIQYSSATGLVVVA
jgi:CRISPR-associated endonuclease/helicase Cas3